MMNLLFLLFTLIILVFPRLTLSCSSDVDCSLNGVCDVGSGVCECDAGWTDSTCSSLKLSSTQLSNGINFLSFNTSTWCISYYFENSTELYHVFYSRMLHECQLSDWQTNSACYYLVTKDPFSISYTDESHQVVIDAFCHNPQILSAFDKKTNNTVYLLIHIGAGIEDQTKPKTCSPTSSPLSTTAIQKPREKNLDLKVDSDANWDVAFITLAYSYSIAGNYIPLDLPLIEGRLLSWDLIVSNPSALAFPDGSILLAYRGRSIPDSSERINIAFADDFRGPYTRLLDGPMLDIYAEDPYLYADMRGNFHILYHNFNSSGGHFFALSSNPKQWYASPQSPYNLTVSLSDGTSLQMRRRERPFLLQSHDHERRPLALFNGVVPPNTSGEPSFSLGVPIDP